MSQVRKDLDGLLQKQMDRRDFIKHVAVGFVALTGVAAVVKTLNTLSGPRGQAAGYGASVYGGNRAKTPKS